MATAPVIFPEPQQRPRRTAIRVAGRSHLPEVFFEKQIDNSRVVREVDPARRRKCYSLLGGSVLAFIFIFGFALQHFECVKYGYQIEQLKSQRSKLKEANQKLRLEQALLADPQRIDRLARTDLGLAPSDPHQTIRLNGASPEALQPGAPVVARNFAALAPTRRGIPREP